MLAKLWASQFWLTIMYHYILLFLTWWIWFLLLYPICREDFDFHCYSIFRKEFESILTHRKEPKKYNAHFHNRKCFGLWAQKMCNVVKLTFSDLVEIPNFEHFEFCPKFWRKMLNNANEWYSYYLKGFVVIFEPKEATLNIIKKKSAHQIWRNFWLTENDQKNKKLILGEHSH